MLGFSEGFSVVEIFRKINWQFNFEMLGVQTEVVVNWRPLLGLSLIPNQGRSGNQKVNVCFDEAALFYQKGEVPSNWNTLFCNKSGESSLQKTLENSTVLALGLLSPFCACPMLSLILWEHPSALSHSAAVPPASGGKIFSSCCTCVTPHLLALGACCWAKQASGEGLPSAVRSAIRPGGTASISGPSSTYGLCASGISEILSCGCVLLSVSCPLVGFDVCLSLSHSQCSFFFFGVTGPLERNAFGCCRPEEFWPNVVGWFNMTLSMVQNA